MNILRSTYWRAASQVRELRWVLRGRCARAKGASVAHFLHINKAAGSALKEALFQNRVTPRYVLKLHTHFVTLRDVPVGEKFFFFLRDPITRYVSGFNHRLHKGRPKYFMEWSSEESRVFTVFDTAEALALGLSSNDSNRRELAEYGMRNIFHVRTSYYDWFESDSYFDTRRDDLLFIGFQEQMLSDFGVLVELLNLPSSVKLPDDYKVANRYSPVEGEERLAPLSDQAVENLRAWYAADIAFYNRCRALAESF